MLEGIKEDLKQRMANYTDSRQPTAYEVTIAWLISEIDRLNKELDTLKSHSKNKEE